MVLVSGATGFLGSYIVCELLHQNKKVRALRRAQSNLKEFELISRIQQISEKQLQNLEWFIADILEFGDLETAFEGVDEVIHAAAMVSFRPEDKPYMFQVNVEGTANMVNLSLSYGIKKFGHISSIAAIGRSETEPLVSETTKWERSENNTAYAETKHTAEMEVWRGIQEGLNAVIVNPGIIIGVGDFNKGSGKMFQSAFKGMRFFTPGVSGFVDVRDVSSSIVRLMEKNISGERYILVSENYPFKQFYDVAAACFKKSGPRFNTPLWLASIGYRGLWLMSKISGTAPLLTRETTLAAYRKYYYNNTKIKQALSFEFIPVQSTIEWTCANFN